VDSSPAVVGNRVYFGVGTNSLLSGSRGSICCVDADTGALAWRWTGDKELPTPLRAIFSSPVIAVEAPEKGAPPAARYLVSGEGYHEDKDGRLICLDLEPVRRSKGKEPPKLVWFLQATDHVEATPCIHEGKVFVGAGDDGYWCVELATGKVLWHLEGSCDTYELKGPQSDGGRRAGRQEGRGERRREAGRRRSAHQGRPRHHDDRGGVVPRGHGSADPAHGVRTGRSTARSSARWRRTRKGSD
jgi:outer membrane protein assembly factor BamB